MTPDPGFGGGTRDGPAAAVGPRVAGLAFTAAHLLVGAWLLVSPLALEGSLVDAEDDLAVGVLLVLLGVYGVTTAARRVRPHRDALVASALAGLWLLAFSVEYGAGRLLMYDGLLAGVLLVVLDLYLYRRLRRRGPGGG